MTVLRDQRRSFSVLGESPTAPMLRKSSRSAPPPAVDTVIPAVDGQVVTYSSLAPCLACDPFGFLLVVERRRPRLWGPCRMLCPSPARVATSSQRRGKTPTSATVHKAWMRIGVYQRPVAVKVTLLVAPSSSAAIVSARLPVARVTIP